MRNITVSAYSAERLQEKLNVCLSRVDTYRERITHMEYSTNYDDKVKETVFSVCIILK